MRKDCKNCMHRDEDIRCRRCALASLNYKNAYWEKRTWKQRVEDIKEWWRRAQI